MFWSPSEISTKILRNVTSRQITDLAERGIIKPIKDTSGRGVPRFYDLNGVLDIAVACALRSVLSPYLVKEIVKAFRDYVEKAAKGDMKPWDLFIIKRSEKSGRVGIAVVPFGNLEGKWLRWEDDKQNSKTGYLTRQERLEKERGPMIQVVPLDWEDKLVKKNKNGGVCDPIDHRVIILNITDLRGEILAAIGEG